MVNGDGGQSACGPGRPQWLLLVIWSHYPEKRLLMETTLFRASFAPFASLIAEDLQAAQLFKPTSPFSHTSHISHLPKVAGLLFYIHLCWLSETAFVPLPAMFCSLPLCFDLHGWWVTHQCRLSKTCCPYSAAVRFSPPLGQVLRGKTWHYRSGTMRTIVNLLHRAAEMIKGELRGSSN